MHVLPLILRYALLDNPCVGPQERSRAIISRLHFPPPTVLSTVFLLHMGYFCRNASAVHKVRSLQSASTAEKVQHGIDSIAEYVATNLGAQQLDATLRIESRRDIVDACGIDAIVKGMIRHETDLSVQIAGCRALANISHDEHNRYESQSSNIRRILIARRGGLDAVLRALDRSHRPEGFDPPSNNNAKNTRKLREQACRALWAFSFHPRVKNMILKQGGEESIRAVLADVSKRDPLVWGKEFNTILWAGHALDSLLDGSDTNGGMVDKSHGETEIQAVEEDDDSTRALWFLVLALSLGLCFVGHVRQLLPSSALTSAQERKGIDGVGALIGIVALWKELDPRTRLVDVGSVVGHPSRHPRAAAELPHEKTAIPVADDPSSSFMDERPRWKLQI